VVKSATPKIAVVIATSQAAPPALRHVLVSLQRQTIEDFECVVVFDGVRPPPDYFSLFSGDPRFGVVIDESGTYQSAARARNTGFRHTSAPRVVITDDDCLCPRDLLAAHLDCDKNEVVVIGTRVHVPGDVLDRFYRLYDPVFWTEPELLPVVKQDMRRRSQREWEWVKTLCERERQPKDLPWRAYTCHLSVPAPAWTATGGLWTEMRGSGHEDVEWAFRLQRHGCRFLLLEKPQVYHVDHPVSRLQSAALAANKKLQKQTFREAKVVMRNGAPLVRVPRVK
jgi:GT2 family glycosyltransferase